MWQKSSHKVVIGFPDGQPFLKDLYDGKDRSNMHCLLSFDGFSPNDPKHELSPNALYSAEKAAKRPDKPP